MENTIMPTTVFDNIPGSELPAAWRRKMKADPQKRYSISIQPQEERRTFLEVVEDIQDQAKKRGMTPEILAGILGTSVEEIS